MDLKIRFRSCNSNFLHRPILYWACCRVYRCSLSFARLFQLFLQLFALPKYNFHQEKNKKKRLGVITDLNAVPLLNGWDDNDTPNINCRINAFLKENRRLTSAESRSACKKTMEIQTGGRPRAFNQNIPLIFNE